MKHVAIIVNPETKHYEVVLKWPAFNPIGPRLEKGLKMPTCKTSGILAAEYAIIAAKEIDDWMEKQAQGERTPTTKANIQHDHYTANKDFSLKAEEKKPEPPKLAPPPPPPLMPPPKKMFVPEPFDAE